MHTKSITSLIKFLEMQNFRFRCSVPLKEYTTFRLGGNCPCIIHCETPRQVHVIVLELVKIGLDFIIIGSGSNLLVSDSGFPAIIIRYVSSAPSILKKKNTIIVSGGTGLDKLVEFTVKSGIGGFVNCSGIPGTVGGAIIGNAGAFGWQVADCLESIHVIDKHGAEQNVFPEDIGFSYRNSGLRERQQVVLSARFKVFRHDSRELNAKREEILKLRAEKHPDITLDACAGSFFKNIEPTSAAGRRQAAGWFLEQAGAKEMRVGGAGVFEKHANIIIQKNNPCTTEHVFKLSCRMAEAVKEQFGIKLEQEVQLLGKF